MQESKYRCINVYAPNNEYERVKFISALPSIRTDSDEEDTYIETILGGDFNCVMTDVLDRKNCNSNQDVGQVDVKNIMDTFELEDVWRRRNPDKLSYTWEGRGKSSRIDYWIISKSIDGQTDQVMHTPAHFQIILPFRLISALMKRSGGVVFGRWILQYSQTLFLN